jgi:hypothetical protein
MTHERTGDVHALEVLVRAIKISASMSFCFRWANWKIWVNLVAVGHRQETTRHILRIIWVVTVRLELPQWALVRYKPRRVRLFFHCCGLCIVSEALARIIYVRMRQPLPLEQVRPVALELSRQQ